jgi:hypothetical protein
VTSRAIFAPPTTRPVPSLIGDTDRDTSMIVPSLRTRCVSKWGTRSPRARLARMRRSSPSRSGGSSIVTDAPSASAAV